MASTIIDQLFIMEPGDFTCEVQADGSKKIYWNTLPGTTGYLIWERTNGSHKVIFDQKTNPGIEYSVVSSETTICGIGFSTYVPDPAPDIPTSNIPKKS